MNETLEADRAYRKSIKDEYTKGYEKAEMKYTKGSLFGFMFLLFCIVLVIFFFFVMSDAPAGIEGDMFNVMTIIGLFFAGLGGLKMAMGDVYEQRKALRALAAGIALLVMSFMMNTPVMMTVFENIFHTIE